MTVFTCTRRTAPLIVALIFAASAGACRDTSARRADSAALPGRSVPTPTQGATDTATIMTPRGGVIVRGDSSPGAVGVSSAPLLWSADVLIARLTAAGLAPMQQGPVRQPLLGATGLRVAVGSGAAEVQAFIFGDAGAVGRATQGLDVTRVARSSGPSARWTPTLVADNNLAAIVLTTDEALRDRIRRALYAPHP